MNQSALIRTAETEVARLLPTLPRDIRDLADALPLVCLPRPTRAMLSDGLEPDLLGLFVGPSLLDSAAELDGAGAADPLPPQILLFVQNLWKYAESDLETYRSEVRITYLHELGHYLGLEESDLADRNLD